MGRTRAADCPQLKLMGWKRGHPVVLYWYWAHYYERPNLLFNCTFFRPGLQSLGALLALSLSSPHRGQSSGSILQRVCGPFI